MKLEHIDHIGVIVNSAEESLDFYTEALGLNYEGKATSEITGDSYYHLVFDKDGLDSHLELVEVSEKSPLKKAEMDRNGINHIAYRVDDVESAVKDLSKAGCEAILEPTVIGEITFAYLKVADDYVFEVMEMPEKYDNSSEVPAPD